MTPHFTLLQALQSSKASELDIDNTAGPDERRNIELVANCLEQFHWLVGKTTSWFRCDALNTAVGGVPESRHTMGLAVDFRPSDMKTPMEVAMIIKGLRMSSVRKVIIYENSKHVHVSFWQHDENKIPHVKEAKFYIKLANGSYSPL